MSERPLSLTFLGATGTVTGSKYLLDDGRVQVLVDCGLFQGFKQLRLCECRVLQGGGRVCRVSN